MHFPPSSAIGTAYGSGFWRLSQSGVFEAFFDALASMSEKQKGQNNQALGRSRGALAPTSIRAPRPATKAMIQN
jgi:hypothetical protein